VIGNSKYREPFRELLVGVKQRGRCIELALEFPSENAVGQDESPSLQGQDIGMACIWSKRVVNHASSLLAKVFCYPAMNSGVHSLPIQAVLLMSNRVYSIWNKREWYRGSQPFRLFDETEGFFACGKTYLFQRVYCSINLQAGNTEM
jgi:hypothetical protein